MPVVLYSRTATDEAERQLARLARFAANRFADRTEQLVDTCPGDVELADRLQGRQLRSCRRGDTIVVETLTALGDRDLPDSLYLWQMRGVKVVVADPAGSEFEVNPENPRACGILRTWIAWGQAITDELNDHDSQDDDKVDDDPAAFSKN